MSDIDKKNMDIGCVVTKHIRVESISLITAREREREKKKERDRERGNEKMGRNGKNEDLKKNVKQEKNSISVIIHYN